MDPQRVAIAVLTYQRPAELAAALPLLLKQAMKLNRMPSEKVMVDLLVVDNDPELSAKPIVDALNSDLLRYVAEPIPGIAAARNRALDENCDRDVLIFIDDDERPRPAWLAPLLGTWRQTLAAGVMGRVVSEFEGELDPWVAAGSFFTRRSMKTGTPIQVAAAGNLLLDLNQVRTLGVRFHHDFGLTGGEDTLFSRQLVAAGGRLVWCQESVATDWVPATRATRKWVLRRAWSHGNSATLVEVHLRTRKLGTFLARASGISRGVIRMTGGVIRFGFGVLTHSDRHEARGLRTAYRGAGLFAGAVGIVYQEYSRDKREE